MIHLNKNPSGKLSNMGFGFAAIADGLVRILSLGILCSTFALDYAREQARKRFTKIAAQRNE